MKKINYQLQKKTLIIMFLMLSVFNLFSQESYWSIGGTKMYMGETQEPLRVRFNNSSLTSRVKLGKIGGVAFKSVATPHYSMSISNMDINYVSGNSDGYRLQVIINSDTVYPYLPDWQLIPIIKYSNSYHNSCVTYTGPIGNNIQYHEAFQDELIGLRLLQADLILGMPYIHKDLPKYNTKYNKRTIYGTGERYISTKSEVYKNNIARSITKTMEKRNNYFVFLEDSWVLTDVRVNPTFRIKNEQLVIEGLPYYYIYEREYSSPNNSLLEKKLKDRNEWLYIYENLNPYSDGYKAYANLCIDSIDRLSEEIAVIPYKVKPINSLIKEVKNEYSRLYSLNPYAMSATQNVMQYSAFFRYFKKNYSKQWSSLYYKVKFKKTSPQIKTPTRSTNPNE